MAREDKDPWVVERGEGPIIATAIHNGHELRPEVAALCVLDEAVRLREEDPYTGRLADIVPTQIVVQRSRFEVDLNRPRDKAVYLNPEDAWGLELWREPPGAEVVAESLAVYDKFYGLLRSVVEHTIDTYGRFVVLDLHSYNHRRAGADQPASDAGGNPEVNVGTGSVDRERWGHLIDRFMEDLRSVEVNGRYLDVRENVRFQGGHMSRWAHEQFPGAGCVLAIEFKKVFMDEWAGVPDDAEIAGLRAALAATTPGLVETVG